MVFNNFEINVDYKGNYDLYTSNDKCIIVDQESGISVMFEVSGGNVLISSIDYGTKIKIDTQKNIIHIIIPDPMEFE